MWAESAESEVIIDFFYFFPLHRSFSAFWIALLLIALTADNELETKAKKAVAKLISREEKNKS